MRVFMGLSDVSGFYFNLARGFSEIGVDADHITLVEHKFRYSDGSTVDTPRIVRMARWSILGRSRANEKNLMIRVYWLGMAFLLRVLLLIWALAKYDVFILSGGTSFFRFREFPILKFFNKRIIYAFHGTDDRPAFLDGFAEDMYLPYRLKNGNGYLPLPSEVANLQDRLLVLQAYRKLIDHRLAVVQAVERHADIIIGNPASAQHHTKPYVKSGFVGVPFNPSVSASGDLANISSHRIENESVVILHSPSYPPGKGSAALREMVAELKIEFPNIEYIEVTNRPNHEVLQLIAHSDIVIDQLYTDFAMAGLATEAAFFRKPAVVGGYYASIDSANYPPDLQAATNYIHPSEVPAEIRRLIADPAYRKERGDTAYNFVMDKRTAKQCATQYLHILNDTVPDDWFCNPAECRYLGGMGLSAERLRSLIADLYNTFGENVFHLADKPALLKQIRDLATSPPES